MTKDPGEFFMIDGPLIAREDLERYREKWRASTAPIETVDFNGRMSTTGETTMIDVTAIEKEAREELAKEMGTAAKTKIKASLRAINMAEKALINLRNEHAVLMRDIGSDADAA